jgi:hypothetical protein
MLRFLRVTAPDAINPPPVDPPPPPPDPDPVDPPGTTGFIDHAPTLALRNTLAGLHGLGTDPLDGYEGISDTTGFAVYECTTADQLKTALAANATTATTRKLIRLQWNGVQNIASTGTISGPGTAALASYVNAGEIGGYDYPPHAVKVIADPGYTPAIGTTTQADQALFLRGFGKVHFEGIRFTEDIDVARVSDRPLMPLVAFVGCTFNKKIGPTDVRALHMPNCIFDGPTVQISPKAYRFRLFNFELKNKNKDGDFINATGMSSSLYTGLRPAHWLFGGVVHTCDDVTQSGNHYDFFQYGIGAEAYLGIDVLIEFCLNNSNVPASQGTFGDVSGTTQQNRFVVHNTLHIANAYGAITLKDPSGTGELRAYRNHVLRGATPLTTQFTNAHIQIIRPTSGSDPTTGVYDIRENYVNTITVSPAYASVITNVANFLVSNTPAAANHVSEIITGNDSWGVNSAGYTNYTDPGDGLSAAAARTAIRNFFLPIGGYRVEGAGMTDPNTWPTEPQNVLT